MEKKINSIKYKECSNCKKLFYLSNVKNKVPKYCHEEFFKLWEKSDLEFYCSYCYLLKLLKEINK